MALVVFNVSEELARQIRGLVDSGRAADITFCVRSRLVVEVRAENIWRNEMAVPGSNILDRTATTGIG